MSPLLLIWVQTRELLEAGPNSSVKSLQRFGVEAGWHNPGGKHHFAKREAAAEQLQRDLRVWQLTKQGQEAQGLVNATLSVLVAEGW